MINNKKNMLLKWGGWYLPVCHGSGTDSDAD